MADVLLASAYFLCLDPKQHQKMSPYPPLGTLYVAANLRERGYDVAVFDAMLSDGPHELDAHLSRHDPSVLVLVDDCFNFLSKMCLTRMRDAALAMVAAGRRHGVTVCASGPDVTDHPEPYLAAGAHATIVGEPDHTIAELLAWLGSTPPPGTRPDHIAGLVLPAVRTNGADPHAPRPPTRTARRANERHPDVFPHPARDLVDVEAYRQRWVEHHGEFSLNLVSTRGCPFHCNWCAKPIWGQRYAMRSPRDVVMEMHDVKRTIGPDHVWFADDIFGLRPSWLAEFAPLVHELDAAIPFTIQSRCDLMTEPAVAALAHAGCREVWLGAESGSQSILDAMDKGTTLDDIRTARAHLGAAGIEACFFIQLGYPGEDWADIEATVTLLRETLPDDIGVSVSYPLPGTPFHEMVRAQLGGKENWEDSDDLDMLFQGTFTTPFYRHLHRLLHDDLALHRRRAGLPARAYPGLAAVPAACHESRVAAGWESARHLAQTCRSERPTTLLRVRPAPAPPDLSRMFG
jgi:anaerobic magnesium-protoporphyrin IX monomethyl ester cyclase